MSNYCIGCKRELAPGQQDCHICGAPQAYLKYHFKSILLFVISMVLIAAFGVWYVGQVSLKAEVERNNYVTEMTDQFDRKIRQLELSLAETQEALKQAQAAGSQVSDLANQEKAKLAASEDKATKAEARAGWLSKENRRFRNQITELEQKVKELEASVNSANAVENEPLVEPPQEAVLESENQIE